MQNTSGLALSATDASTSNNCVLCIDACIKSNPFYPLIIYCCQHTIILLATITVMRTSFCLAQVCPVPVLLLCSLTSQLYRNTRCCDTVEPWMCSSSEWPEINFCVTVNIQCDEAALFEGGCQDRAQNLEYY